MSGSWLVARSVSKVAGMAVSGVLGVVIVDAVRTGRARQVARSGVVSATAWGLRAQRRAEERAESVRLGFGDVVAEARERNGDEARPPADQTGHDHDH